MQQATQAADRSEALPKFRRLAKRREFLRVYEGGRKFFARFVVVFTATNEFAYSRLGVTATKKLGKANARNRVKRWTREVYRKERCRLDLDAKPIDLVVNVKPNAADITFEEFRQDLLRALRRAAAENRP